MTKKPSKLMLKRMFIVLVTVVLVTVSVCGVSLTLTMVVNGEKLQGMASEQQLYDSLITAPRGNIYDKNMNVLATSTTAWTVYITPNGILKLKDETKRETIRNKIADGLAEILSVDREKIYNDTGKSSYYIIVKKKVDKTTSDKVRQFLDENSSLSLSKYVGLDETTKRYYPNGRLASVTLGFVGDDDQGLAGIESYYDTTLTGEAGRVVAAKTAYGTDMPFTYEMVEEAKQGNSLVLTIDNRIQYVVEKHLRQAVEDNKCTERGVSIVMNIKTGEILAMAVTGDFDPNEPFTLSAADQKIADALSGEERTKKLAELRNRQWRNKAVSDSYEPGSVFKIVTAAAALEEGVANINSTFTCSGKTQVAGQKYNCHKHSGHGTQTLLQATSNSCNPAFITLGQMIGVSSFSKYFESFGLTAKTGIDLPGETASIYYKAENMGPVELASASFGQSFQVTPIQLITAVATAANGGYLVQPHLVAKVIDNEKNVIETASTAYRRQVISNETSNTLRTILEGVVNGGAKNGYVAGFRTGGKTGTSEKLTQLNQTGQKLYVASYVALAPIEDPEIAVLVLLDEPHGNSIYGGTISAPVGSAILSEILPYMGFEPHYSNEELKVRAIPVPDVAGLELDSAKSKINKAGLIYHVVGNGEKVVSQLPSSNETLYSGGLVILYTEENSGEQQQSVVPNFIGMNVSQCNSVAAENGINIEFSGNILSSANTLCYKQSVAKDTKINKGQVVTLYFRDGSVTDFDVG